MVAATDLDLSPGRTLRVYDTAAPDGVEELTVIWHHGTPNTGEPPLPLLPAAAERGIRFVSYDRPGYGSSTPRAGRDVASAAGDVAAIADALRIDRFAVMGHSGGATHALASAAILTERVLATVCLSTVAPIDAAGLDWFAGMAPSCVTKLRAAARGRAALEEYLAASEWDPAEFTTADHQALHGEWSWLGTIAGTALQGGQDGLVDDELAYVAPYGFDPGRIAAPILFVHGAEDRVAPRSHAEWLAQHCSSAELWLRPGDGHISILSAGVATLDWLRDRVARDRPG